MAGHLRGLPGDDAALRVPVDAHEMTVDPQPRHPRQQPLVRGEGAHGLGAPGRLPVREQARRALREERGVGPREVVPVEGRVHQRPLLVRREAAEQTLVKARHRHAVQLAVPLQRDRRHAYLGERRVGGLHDHVDVVQQRSVPVPDDVRTHGPDGTSPH